MNPEKLLRRILEDNHYKATTPRLLLFTTLLGSKPLSLSELIRSLSGSVDRVSIYRSVTLFEKLGITRRVSIGLGWKYKIELSELFLDHHHHITCLGCNTVIAVRENPEIERLITALGSNSGYSHISHQLELQGYCRRCSGKALASTSTERSI